jgi:eukaryotic-like serine/threonine-protein kinase
MAGEHDSRVTLLRAGTPSRSARPPTSWSLLPDLHEEAARRIRAVALVYGTAYFLSGVLPPLLFADGRAVFFSRPLHWLPAAVSIGAALALAWLVGSSRFSARVKILAGLAFEVIGSYGIAAAEYQNVLSPIIRRDYGQADFGLSWVSVWVLLFTMVIPTPPRVAILGAALSLSAVPVMFALGDNMAQPPMAYFVRLVLPYLVVLLVAYIGSRVIHGLRAEVSKAREMGSYRLVERLGKGGMGEVWRAQHRLLARPAAIKLIRPEVLGGEDPGTRELLLRRFEREAQATAQMCSPHTLALYDFGVADDGTFYYVMELLDGFDLARLVERFGPVPPARAVHFLRQVCASLGEAHEAGLIHRDVKPANLYVCRYGREVDFIKVLDFGLVKHDRPGRVDEGAENLSAAHMSPGGTPAFMSPEQALGESPVDARSDLYAVGCVAYWLLTGSLVFRGVTPMETVVMHVSREPEPPSQRTTRPIPPDLEGIVLSCLAKNPAERPQTADELAERLVRARIGEAWTREQAMAWWEANVSPPSAVPAPR